MTRQSHFECSLMLLSVPTRFDVVFSRRFHSGLIRNWKFFGFDMDVGDFELPD